MIAEISIKDNEKSLEDGVDESTIPKISTNLDSLRRDFDNLLNDLESIELK